MIRRVSACLGLLSLAPAASAQAFFTAVHDNDEWGGKQTDWEYSQGTRFAWMDASWAESARTIVSLLPGIEPSAKILPGVGAGASFYEPRFLASAAPIRDQRPYAGWLYVSGLLNAETSTHLDSWRLDIGVVGPSAQGEQITKFFHNVFSGYDQLGWDNQIQDRLGLNASWERRWRNIIPISNGIAVDLSPAIGVELGTVSDAINAGAMLRVGTGLETDFGPPRTGAFGGSLAHGGQGFSLYGFAAANASYVPWDVFLDEPGGRDSDLIRAGDQITRDKFRSQVTLGLVATWQRLRLTFAVTDASTTYDQQVDAERFSEMNLSFRF